MAYTKQTWVDNDPTKPLSAARLNHMEDGIEGAYNLSEEIKAQIARDTSSLKPHINLFNNKDWGILSDYEALESGFIYLDAGTYCFSIQHACLYNYNKLYVRYKLYDLNKNPKTSSAFDFNAELTIGSNIASNQNYVTFVISEPCYIRTRIQQSSTTGAAQWARLADAIQIEKGSTPTAYEEYYDELNYPKPESPSTSDLLKRTKNLFNKEDIIVGALQGFNYIVASGHFISNMIPIEAGKTYSLSFVSNNVILNIYDSTGNPSTNASSTNVLSSPYSFTAVRNGFVRLCSHSDVDSKIQFEEGASATTYVPYYEVDSGIEANIKKATIAEMVEGDIVINGEHTNLDTKFGDIQEQIDELAGGEEGDRLPEFTNSKNLFNKAFANVSVANNVSYDDYILLKAGTYYYGINGGFFGYNVGQWFLRGKYYNLDKTPKTSSYTDVNKQLSYAVSGATGDWFVVLTITEDCYFKPAVVCTGSGSPANLPDNYLRVVDYIFVTRNVVSGTIPVVVEDYYSKFTYPENEQPSASDVLKRTRNLFNKDDIQDGYVVSLTTFNHSGAYDNGKTSKHPIKIENGKTYVFSTVGEDTSNIRLIVYDLYCMLDNNSLYLQPTNGKIIYTATFDGYVFLSGTYPDKWQFEENSDKTDYVPYYVPNEEYFDDSNESDYANKVLYVFGDSIMAASTVGVDGVGEQLRDKYGMTLSNYAIDGRTITFDNGDDYNTVYYEIDHASSIIPNYIIWNGGTNDISNWPTLAKGTISSGFNDTLDTDTFCGAFEKTIKTLLTKYPGARIIYCTTHVNAGRDLADQQECWELCRQICHKWGIAIADINHDSGLNTFLPEYKGVYTDAGGTHPNTNGYKLFYLPVVEHKM